MGHIVATIFGGDHIVGTTFDEDHTVGTTFGGDHTVGTMFRFIIWTRLVGKPPMSV